MNSTRKSLRGWCLSLAAAACMAGLPAILGACESDEAVGHTKTTTKQTVDTPNGKTTTTTTHEKKTDVYPK